MTSGKEIDLWMRRNHPEPIQVSFERLNGSPLTKIPDPDSLVFADGEDEILVWMEGALLIAAYTIIA